MTQRIPNAIMEGNTEEVGILVEGLEPLTYYYVFVRSNCADGPGAWSAGTRFRSNGGALLECGGGHPHGRVLLRHG
jgi:hypothetical protein